MFSALRHDTLHVSRGRTVVPLIGTGVCEGARTQLVCFVITSLGRQRAKDTCRIPHRDVPIHSSPQHVTALQVR